MADDFKYDVFLSHSAKDKAVVRPIAERLRADGLRVWLDDWEIRPGDHIPAKIEEGLERSRVLVLCVSANAFGSDWAQLEAGTFRFRDPLNKERRFILLRLDESPIKGSVAQLLHINWLSGGREQAFSKLLGAIRPPSRQEPTVGEKLPESIVKLDSKAAILDYAFSPNRKRALTGGYDSTVQLWDVETGRCLRVLEGHKDEIWSVQLSADRQRALSGSKDKTVRLWDLMTGHCLGVFEGHKDAVSSVAWSADERRVLSSSHDMTLRVWDVGTGRRLRMLLGPTSATMSVVWSANEGRALLGSADTTIQLWDLESGRRLRVLQGHTGAIWSLAWSADQRRALSGSQDTSVRLWDMETGRCLRVFEGHARTVRCIAWRTDQRFALTGSYDGTLRLWDVETGRCLRVLKGDAGTMSMAWSGDHRRVLSGDSSGGIRVWDLAEFVTEVRTPKVTTLGLPPAPDQVQYTNAKVLLVGDTSAGKTGLAHRLATGEWKPSDGSTVGAWSTQWKLGDAGLEPGLEREIWLWDFGGQADQRLIHQLYMDRTDLILLLFNADQEDVLPGLRGWQTALRRCVWPETPQLLVAGRTDAGFKASRGKLQRFAAEHHLAYHETSAREGTGCKELRAAIMAGIPWTQMERRTSPHIFKLIKDEILKLRDEGEVLHTFKELRELLSRRLPKDPRFSDDTLHTVIGLLDGPGAVKELDYGTYILLQPEWVNVYAQAVIRTLRSGETDLGCLPLRSIAEGKLVYQSLGQDGVVTEMRRLPPPEERIVLGEMERQLMERGLCLRQGDKLVFPSHCGRDRPAVVEHPAVFVSPPYSSYYPR